MRTGLILGLDRYMICYALLCSDVILYSSFIEYLPIEIVYIPTLHEYHCLRCVVYSYVQRVYFEHFTRLGALHGCMHTFWEHYTTPGSKEGALAISRIEG